MQRWLPLAVLLIGFQSTITLAQPGEKGQPTKPLRTLPGVEPDGSIRLHNTWRLMPAGKQIELGDYPVQIVVHPTGEYLAVLHCGYGPHEIIVLDVQGTKQQIVSRTVIEQGFYGLCFNGVGDTLYVSGGDNDVVHAFAFAKGYLSQHRRLKVPAGSFVGGIALDSGNKQLAVAGTWGHVVNILSTSDPQAQPVKVVMEAKSFPYTCLFDKDRNRLYVSLWAKARIAVFDLNDIKVITNFATDLHPTEMQLSGDSKYLYVACANSTKVNVISAADGKVVQTIATSLFPNAPNGTAPCSLSMTPDGQLLFVANADNNNVALFNISDPKTAKPLGFIPVGYYPTSVRYNPADKRIYVANARGATPKANSQGPNPLLPKNQSVREYIAGLYRGTLSIVEMPTEERMQVYSKQAYACAPLREDLSVRGEVPKDSPIPAKAGDAGPFKYCVYIIRENRTYDQVFGDVKEGNGDPNLCIFGEKVTPNAHSLAKEFVLLDNFYAESEVSADGHEWSMGAYCTDFVKKAWPLNYRPGGNKVVTYPAEGFFDEIARPAGGYLWDRCAQAGVSYRSYGEWVQNGKTTKDPAKALVKALEGHIDPMFRGFDMDYSDVKRAERYITELKEFEKAGKMPQLTIVRLPNDHTAGTKVGKPTPIAYVAENDLALGMVVEALSNSRFWKETAIFVVEDDAQNGSDHVDAHRTVALVISPYSRKVGVDSTMYATSSMLRTMELILGLRPMSQFDAAATPMYRSFLAKPDFQPYQHVEAEVDLKAANTKTAWGADLSEKMDFTKEDAVDDLLLNEVIWRSVRGANSPMPAPVRSAFVFPRLGKDD
jgi:DNA-binding beta-propeller fold protein YncE